ncbi:MAG TPA: ORF6N domain-containing protein [Steroidobacteraceae bacterium]|nr:ORF6N domain-containing protein [Steroidobacteraceae bacterium]
MNTGTGLVPLERITRAILVLRGQRVILDRELAAIYGVSTKRLNEQVKRNAERFPEDFMFQLSPEEAELSRSQFATLKGGRGQNIKYRPYAFTEHGAIQAANVLSSPAPWRWASTSCAPSCSCGRSSPRTRTSHASSSPWNAPSSRWT